MEAIAFRKATETDIEEYRSWFGQDTPQSRLLTRFADLPDEHWIKTVAAGNGVHAWAVLMDSDMVALIRQDNWEPNEATIQIAVKPGHFWQSIGTAAVKQFIADHLGAKDRVLAHIDARNEPALSVARQCGFRQTMAGPDEENLITFCYDVPERPFGE